MNKCDCLAGKVRMCELPVFQGPAGADAPTVKRLLLPQGELAQLHDGEPAIRYLASIELREGTIRGNHFHKVKEEFMYVLQGELLLIIEDTASMVRETVPVRQGQLVVISPGVAHALQVSQSGQALEFSPAPFDPADTYRYPLV